ncbi:hypothetical protein [Streptomyces violaceusniger]|uniref:Uncharacterized protein n=1 Tax=Streptomyces violaceusniger TaxID=68280 RepID=A0A4D4KZS9_STRVO|nr:hypothetical protein SVIO_050780 [Streptomyces violaceusniger]
MLSGYGPVGRAYAERLVGGTLPLRLAAVRASAAEGLPPEPRHGERRSSPLGAALAMVKDTLDVAGPVGSGFA